MDGCTRQNPAYRPAKGRAPLRRGLPIGREAGDSSRFPFDRHWAWSRLKSRPKGSRRSPRSPRSAPRSTSSMRSPGGSRARPSPTADLGTTSPAVCDSTPIVRRRRTGAHRPRSAEQSPAPSSPRAADRRSRARRAAPDLRLADSLPDRMPRRPRATRRRAGGGRSETPRPTGHLLSLVARKAVLRQPKGSWRLGWTQSPSPRRPRQEYLGSAVIRVDEAGGKERRTCLGWGT
jgi:hypothetical protein